MAWYGRHPRLVRRRRVVARFSACCLAMARTTATGERPADPQSFGRPAAGGRPGRGGDRPGRARPAARPPTAIPRRPRRPTAIAGAVATGRVAPATARASRRRWAATDGRQAGRGRSSAEPAPAPVPPHPVADDRRVRLAARVRPGHRLAGDPDRLHRRDLRRAGPVRAGLDRGQPAAEPVGGGVVGVLTAVGSAVAVNYPTAASLAPLGYVIARRLRRRRARAARPARRAGRE